MTLIQKERHHLQLRLAIGNQLHDDLQDYLWTTGMELPSLYTHSIYNQDITFEFNETHLFLKGCATWTNAREQQEEMCLYGQPAK